MASTDDSTANETFWDVPTIEQDSDVLLDSFS